MIRRLLQRSQGVACIDDALFGTLRRDEQAPWMGTIALDPASEPVDLLLDANADGPTEAQRHAIAELRVRYPALLHQIKPEIERIARRRRNVWRRPLPRFCDLDLGRDGNGKDADHDSVPPGGAGNGERYLLLAFEESREQLFRNATGWGVDFERMEREGVLEVVCGYPEVAGLEDWLIAIQKLIVEFEPKRVAVDSLSALERGATIKRPAPAAVDERIPAAVVLDRHRDMKTTQSGLRRHVRMS